VEKGPSVTDKEYQTQKNRVRKLWDKWFKPLGLGWWAVDLYRERERDEEQPSQIGKTETRWQYRSAAVSFNLPIVADLDDTRLEEAIVHEMTHILVGGIHDLRDDQSREITEYTVTTISRAIIWAREAGEKSLPKK
jgi:hypothetical protein